LFTCFEREVHQVGLGSNPFHPASGDRDLSDRFQKFPSTHHLAWLDSAPARADKVLAPAEAEAFLSGEVIVEEKVDGANLGLSLDPQGQLRAQNRGSYLEAGAHPQFQPLWAWLALRRGALSEALQGGLILFGEWCFAVHSIEYDALPDWFLAFDIFDSKAGRFWASDRRDAWCSELGLALVPKIARGHFSLSQLIGLLGPSRLGARELEGLYVRRESEGWLTDRAKLVRPQFVQAIEAHWSVGVLKKNHLSETQQRAPASPWQ
jgi:hypothetical protein